MKEEIKHLIYHIDCEREKLDFITNDILDVFSRKLEEIKKEMEGCTGEDCIYPIDKLINELKQ